MPLATVLIPTHDRPHQLRRAVASALDQTLDDHEVLVVDDGSPRAPSLPTSLASDPRLRVLALERNVGHAAARNLGLDQAHSRWVTCLDDDDELLPHHLEVAIDAARASDLPAPVAALTGLAVVDEGGAVVERRLPPTLPRGSWYSLEEELAGTSFGVRNTLVVERGVLLGLGGWDTSLASRVHTELFLRLNPVCSLVGVPTVTYLRHRHDGAQVTDDPARRVASQRQVERIHAAAFAARPARAAETIHRQAVKLWGAGDRRAAFGTWIRALRTHAPRTLRRTVATLLEAAGSVRRR